MLLLLRRRVVVHRAVGKVERRSVGGRRPKSHALEGLGRRECHRRRVGWNASSRLLLLNLAGGALVKGGPENEGEMAIWKKRQRSLNWGNRTVDTLGVRTWPRRRRWRR